MPPLADALPFLGGKIQDSSHLTISYKWRRDIGGQMEHQKFDNKRVIIGDMIPEVCRCAYRSECFTRNSTLSMLSFISVSNYVILSYIYLADVRTASIQKLCIVWIFLALPGF